MQEVRTHHQMLSCSVGDRVRFHPPGHDPKTGSIVKYNRKNVMVVTDDHHQWNAVEEALRERVVSAVALAAHRAVHAVAREQVLEVAPAILAGAMGVFPSAQQGRARLLAAITQ